MHLYQAIPIIEESIKKAEESLHMDPKVAKLVEGGVTSSMTLNLVNVVDRDKLGMMSPNDVAPPYARKKLRVSVDEAPEDRSEIDKYQVRSNFELQSASSRAAYDALYESDDDAGVRDVKGAEKVSRGSFGRWTRDEHEAFLRGLTLYGREWKKVADLIPTRSAAQVGFLTPLSSLSPAPLSPVYFTNNESTFYLRVLSCM